MNSIERKADEESIGGPAGVAGTEVRVDAHFIRSAKATRSPVEKRTVDWAGEVRLAR